MRVLSLGAGVQSTTLALMAKHGEAPMPDFAIFADTGWEPQAVYTHVNWLGTVLPFEIHIIGSRSIRTDILKASNPDELTRFASVPFYTDDGGMGRRQCTREFKIEPITRHLRRWAYGLRKGERFRPPRAKAEMLIGISTDEAVRMKPAREKWQVNRWPLIESNMSRGDCLNWLQKKGYPIPGKSSCIGCPYHDDRLWIEMRDNDPRAWADAITVDKAIRSGGTMRGMTAKQYMHPSCVPLDEVVFRQDSQLDLFQNECEGICGV